MLSLLLTVINDHGDCILLMLISEQFGIMQTCQSQSVLVRQALIFERNFERACKEDTIDCNVQGCIKKDSKLHLHQLEVTRAEA